ncbi:VWA domain-containing protein, partial [Moritella marina]
MTDFMLLRPLWLLALLPLIALAWYFRKNDQAKGWHTVLSPEIAKFLLAQHQPATKSNNLFIPLACIWVLTTMALSGPSFSYTERPVASISQAKVMVLDMSLSMRATDLKPNRLAQLRFKSTDILSAVKEGEIGLVAYAGDAFVISPLTTDTSTLLNLLPNLSPEIMPVKGSKPTAGIRQAIELLTNAGYQQGQILLVTDGINTNQADSINTLLADTDYSLSILGLGTEQGAPIKLADGQLLKNNQGTIVVPQLDARLLKDTAKTNSGQVQVITHGSQPLNDLFNHPSRFKNSLNNQKTELTTEQRNDDGIWLLPLIALLAAFSFRKQLFFSFLLVFLLQPEPSYAAETSIWKNDNENGASLYKNKQYQQAADTFSDTNWQASALYQAGEYQQAIDLWADEPSSDSSYNQGNALMQLGNLDDATKAYEQALKLDPENSDAKSNLEVAKKMQQQQKQQGDKGKDNQSQQDSQDQQDSQ